MSQRLTGNAATPATRSARARLPQKSGLRSPECIAPGAWGLFPLFFAAAGLSLREISLLAFAYPAVWGVSQLATVALSDRWGRKDLIVFGMGLPRPSASLPWRGMFAIRGVARTFDRRRGRPIRLDRRLSRADMTGHAFLNLPAETR